MHFTQGGNTNLREELDRDTEPSGVSICYKLSLSKLSIKIVICVLTALSRAGRGLGYFSCLQPAALDIDVHLFVGL